MEILVKNFTKIEIFYSRLIAIVDSIDDNRTSRRMCSGD